MDGWIAIDGKKDEDGKIMEIKTKYEKKRDLKVAKIDD